MAQRYKSAHSARCEEIGSAKKSWPEEWQIDTNTQTDRRTHGHTDRQRTHKQTDV